jgi:hypothetical protein
MRPPLSKGLQEETVEELVTLLSIPRELGTLKRQCALLGGKRSRKNLLN